MNRWAPWDEQFHIFYFVVIQSAFFYHVSLPYQISKNSFATSGLEKLTSGVKKITSGVEKLTSGFSKIYLRLREKFSFGTIHFRFRKLTSG